jgi:hypothetical protein
VLLAVAVGAHALALRLPPSRRPARPSAEEAADA